MNIMSLFVIVPGFGQPQTKLKEEILQHNVRRVLTGPWTKVQWNVCCFDDSPLPELPTDPRLTVREIREKGMPGNFLKRHATPEVVREYDYILIIFDDVLLYDNVYFQRMIYLYEWFRLDVLSPSLTTDSDSVFKYMITQPEQAYELKTTPVCELLCYFMNATAFARYYEHIDEENPWLWGLDMILERHIGLRVGILNRMNMKHFIKGEGYKVYPSKSPYEGYEYMIRKYNEANDKPWTEQPATQFVIIPICSHPSMQP